MEIITGMECRRRWRLDEKLRFVAEAEAAGLGFVEIARRHDVSRGLLWHWRRQVPSCELRSVATTSFLPVQVIPDAGGPRRLQSRRRRRRTWKGGRASCRPTPMQDSTSFIPTLMAGDSRGGFPDAALM